MRLYVSIRMTQNNYYLENTTNLIDSTERIRVINNVIIRNINGVFIQEILPSLLSFLYQLVRFMYKN